MTIHAEVNLGNFSVGQQRENKTSIQELEGMDGCPERLDFSKAIAILLVWSTSGLLKTAGILTFV